MSTNKEYQKLYVIPAKTIASYPGHLDSSDHTVYDAGLAMGAKLHRFENQAHVPYSAIYNDKGEELASPREREQEMINQWNEMHSSTARA